MIPSNKIFCTAPFTTMRIETTINSDITYKPGCVYHPVGKISSLSEFLHGKEMTDLRDNMCNGSTPSAGCVKCVSSESIGLVSPRLHLLNKPWASSNLDIKLLDIFYSNICNLACIMCDPTSSSKLASERHAIGFIDKIPRMVNNTDRALEAMDQLPNLESVSLIGGEFFIFKDNLIILDKIIEKKLGCRIVTNATVITDTHLVKLKQIPNLEIQISVDGIGKSYEFIRYPAVWTEVEQNIKRIKSSLPQANINFRIVVQPLNIQYLPDALEHFNKLLIPTHAQNMGTPSELSWPILTEMEKQSLDQLLHNKLQYAKITKQQKDDIVKFINGINQSQFDQGLRNKAIDLLSKTLSFRKISKEDILTHFGIFTGLAEEIIQQL
jgi:sulfatase maturation enzyme AslB (radical SAM superfamily)